MKCAHRIRWLCGLLGAGLIGAHAQEKPDLILESLAPDGKLQYQLDTGAATSTNGVVVRYGEAILTAREIVLEHESGDVIARGSVYLQREQAVWRGEYLRYNFVTKQLSSGRFQVGHPPVFAAGAGLGSTHSNQVYVATNAFVTTDNVVTPGYRIEAKRLKVAPGKYVEASNAILYLGDVPIFYFPYYRHSLARSPNRFEFIPGYRSRYGPYLLGVYHWYASTNLSGAVHLDVRQRRGVGAGPDFNYDLGKLGQGEFKGYYAHDLAPGRDPNTNAISADRYRLYFSHGVTLRTNLDARVVVRKQSDIYVVRDFFESEYHKNIQPGSFLEVQQRWPNYSLDLLAQPRVNDFFETVERLPDVKLSGIRQQIGGAPLYYESESSAGYFHRRFANDLTNDFAAARMDTFHQVLLPHTFFGWLNVTPRAGGRLTYYSEAQGDGATTGEETRGVFNTGMEVSFKASRVWRDVQSKLFDLNGLRHIIEPSVNYAYVPSPNVHPRQLPQFDYELASFRLLPIHFPDYHAIDSIDSQNVLRLGVRNKLQTKRAEGLDNPVNWALYTDWRLDPRRGQSRFSDIFSDLDFKPRSWLIFSSELRYDVAGWRWREANHRLTIEPNDTWSISLGHRYLRDDPTAYGLGNNLILSSIYYRFNENWAVRVAHHFEARDGRMESQYYTLYRDLRSWTAALTFRILDNRQHGTDFGVALTFSLKAFPRYDLGHDRAKPSLLLGS
jgi:LPS-assembly protein